MEHEIFKKLEGIEKAILSQKDVLTFEVNLPTYLRQKVKRHF